MTMSLEELAAVAELFSKLGVCLPEERLGSFIVSTEAD